MLLLLSAIKRRWPVLTTVVAALYYVVSNYNIQGLDGLRLEPRAQNAQYPPTGYSGPSNWPAAYATGPALPSTTSPTASTWPTGNLPGNMAGPMLPPSSPLASTNPFDQLARSSTGQSAWPSTGGSSVGYSTGYPGTGLPSTAPNAQSSNLPLPGTSLPSGLNGSMSPLQQPGYQLPGTQPSTQVLPPAAGLPGTSPIPAPLQLPGNMNIDALRLPAAKDLLGAGDWNQLLSVGEKLGMLERSREVPATTVNGGAPAAMLPGLGTQGLGSQGLGSQGQGTRDSLRIASFNLNGWGDAQRGNPAITEIIVRMVRQFDLVALQDIRARRDDVLPDLMTQLNATGRKFDFVIGPRVGRGVTEQLAFVFDTERVETDRFQLYSVADPEDMMAREPLVGWFRARQADAAEAFTFSLVNMHIDRDAATTELQALPTLVEAIANDGRGEDDIILLGDFSAAAPQAAFFSLPTVRTLIEGVATNVRGTQLLDNICIPVTSTTEFTGRAGALDFLRQYNLSLEQATSVSEHLPIWAEFSIIEGGRPGQVAGNALPERRFSGAVN